MYNIISMIDAVVLFKLSTRYSRNVSVFNDPPTELILVDSGFDAELEVTLSHQHPSRPRPR